MLGNYAIGELTIVNTEVSAIKYVYGEKYTKRNTVFTDKFSKRNTTFGDKYSKRNTNFRDKF